MRTFYIGDEVQVEDAGEDLAILVVGGEVDFEVSPQLKARLMKTIKAGRRRLVLDLSDVTFIDSTAIGHGASDEEDMIHMSITADADWLTFAVRDRGTFVMPEPDAPEVSEGGRGLALMATLVDEVDLHIDPGGTTVRLSEARPSEAD